MDLPKGTHHAELTARDIVTGEPLLYHAVWADRPYGHCPRCGQPVPREPGCPLHLNPGAGQGGAIQDYNQQHGCGEWLDVDSTWLGASASEMDIVAAADKLATRLVQGLEDRRAAIRNRLREELRAALAQLAEPLDEDESAEDREEDVRTGSCEHPGVFQDQDENGAPWVAWDYDPDGSGDVIEVAQWSSAR
jgi:hypothetical protein